MKVKELIAILNALDTNLEIICTSESGESINYFDIDEVSVVDGERARDEADKPFIDFGKKSTIKTVIFSLESDF